VSATRDSGWPGFGERLLHAVVPLVYGRRWLTFSVLLALTLLLGVEALRLKPDAGFDKQIPLDHPYMQVFKQYEKAFGGANLISVALMQHAGPDGQSGSLYNAEFLDRLKKLTDATFFLAGVDRTRVSSLFTPDLTYFEVVDGGINLGNVVPRNFTPTPQALETVKQHVEKAGIVGRYVASGQDGALIVAELLEHHPVTGEKLDYHRLASQLEDQLRGRIQSPTMWEYRLKTDQPPYKAGEVVWRGYTDYGWRLRFQTFEAERKTDAGDAVLIPGSAVRVQGVPNPDYAPDLSVHILGFAKVVGDVTDASLEVVSYFFLAMLLIVLLLWRFCGSLRLSLLPLSAAVTAVIWELGLLKLSGFGLDPFAILVPFLILSIGVSHGVQYINGWGHEVAENGRSSYEASLVTFRRLFLPGTVAIVTNVIGFATLAFIHIDIVREMAINAALGMAAVIVTNKVMLPIALTWVRLPDPEAFKSRTQRRIASGDGLWRAISALTQPRWALPTLAVAVLALAWALHLYPRLIVGDTQAGVPELKADSRYNRDAAVVAQNFGIGVDIFKVIAETREYGCLDYPAMQAIDDFVWQLRNTQGVAFATALPAVARTVNSLYHENAVRWAVLPRNRDAMAALVGRVPSSAGLANLDCSRLPVLVFTTDHRASTLERIIHATRAFQPEAEAAGVHLALASGNAGVMAATNEEIRQREWLVIVWVHLTLLLFVWISFRSFASVICIITPLVLCSLLTYGFMATLGIGMKSATLPVAAFGVGIGVDDGIYLWGALVRALSQGAGLRDGFRLALRAAGKATTFTSLALIVSVATWLLSGLQFQVDMGVLLLFMFSTNLLGAILLMPALGWLCHRIWPLQARSGLLVN
jgi:uncharacterized protein